jgi:hypothetical protein
MASRQAQRLGVSRLHAAERRRDQRLRASHDASGHRGRRAQYPLALARSRAVSGFSSTVAWTPVVDPWLPPSATGPATIEGSIQLGTPSVVSWERCAEFVRFPLTVHVHTGDGALTGTLTGSLDSRGEGWIGGASADLAGMPGHLDLREQPILDQFGYVTVRGALRLVFSFDAESISGQFVAHFWDAASGNPEAGDVLSGFDARIEARHGYTSRKAGCASTCMALRRFRCPLESPTRSPPSAIPSRRTEACTLSAFRPRCGVPRGRSDASRTKADRSQGAALHLVAAERPLGLWQRQVRSHTPG